MYEIRTPDNKRFSVSIISRKEADSIEFQYKKNKIEDQFLSTYKRYAFLIDNNRILYRQFYKSIGFVFPNLGDFNKAVRSETYWEVSLQPTDNNNNLIVNEAEYTRIAVSFAIAPAFANKYRKDIVKEISEYEPFESYHFYMLKNGAIVILRTRTADLSDGYWFSSVRDFDFFYYVLSGKDRPKFST